MAEIQIFNSGQRVAKTSRAFDCHVVHELMRMYTLSFSLVNSDPARKYIIAGSQFICDGQAYDIQGFKKQSGSSNITTVTANHVGYRLLNYNLAAGYAFVGTVAQIAADILDKAVNGSVKASAEFEVGTTPDLGTLSFALENTDTVTAKYAIMALKNMGAESDFDNFTINFAETVGSGNSETFEFGVNMDSVAITYDADNGTTYEIGIADLQQIPGHAGDVFDTGDTVTVIDSTTSDSFSKRIVSYDRCIDDPTKNKITLGVFVSDVSTETASMRVDIDTSVQQDTQYSNVSIDHTNGFMAINAAGDLRVVMNSDDCFAVQTKSGDTWTTIQQLTSDGLGATKLFQPGFTPGESAGSYAVIGDSDGSYSESLELHRVFDNAGVLTDEQVFSAKALNTVATILRGNTSHVGTLSFNANGAVLSADGGCKITATASSVIMGTSNNSAYIEVKTDGTIRMVRNGTTLQTW